LFPAKANQNGFAFAIKKCEANMKNIKLTQIISLVLTVFLLSENAKRGANFSDKHGFVSSLAKRRIATTFIVAAWKYG
jgi:hypothetical protein